MKARKGFVSNSSSSSFIIAVDDSSTLELTSTFDIRDVVKKEIATLAGLAAHFAKEYGEDWGSTSYAGVLTDEFEKCADAIQEGKKVLYGSFYSQSPNPIEIGMVWATAEDFEAMGIGKVIHKDEGY